MDGLKKVEVTWLDAWHETGELTLVAALDLRPMVRQSIGYLLKMNEDEIVMAGGIIAKILGGEDTFCDISVTPRSIVKGIVVLASENK